MELSLQFDTPVAAFSVDRPSRQVSGLIMPFGKVAFSGGQDWSFAPGALNFADVSRVKLLRDHDNKQLVGKALSIDERPDGVYGTFKVARGAAGDEILSLAEDGVLDGFSVGVTFTDYKFNKELGANVVSAAKLHETSVTGFPAFDDARVNHVVAMRQKSKEDTMADSATKTVDTSAIEQSETAQFSTEVKAQFGALTEAMKAQSEGLANAITAGINVALTSRKDEAAESRTARFAVIKESPIYNFRGGSQDASIVRDSWRYQIERDQEAGVRLQKFADQQRELSKVDFDNTTANSGQIIPPGYRPDLFVTELNKGRPLNTLVTRGTIGNGNPFTIPRYASNTASVANNVEGTNPASATTTFDTATVSPKAKSGVFTLTRELVDSSNPAVDAIALSVMREDWARATEADLNTALAADATVGVTYASSTPTPLAYIRSELTAFMGRRFSPATGIALSQKAVTDIGAQADTTGRPLLPYVGPQNSSGIGNAVEARFSIDGLPADFAWSVPGPGTVGNPVIYILKKEDVWAWESPMLTFRFEEKLGPANIQLALFGYYGAKVVRSAGVTKIPSAV